MNNEFIADKWVDEGGIFFPISGYTVLHQSIGSGVFELYQGLGQDRRIGLKKVSDSFEFPFKIYELGCEDLLETIQKTWESDEFIEGNKNLGVIFSGTKGTGKTITAKILCKNLGLPVIVVSDVKDGMAEFLQRLSFEAIILIDEAEKTFKEHDELLLRIVDGSYNIARKVYIMTMNKLNVNENLIGRPGRVRYIKQFGNLTEKAVNDYIDDNLKYPERKGDIMKLVDVLEISTIDILRNIVEEVNIHGEIKENTSLNIPRARYSFFILRVNTSTLSEEYIKNMMKFLDNIPDLDTWLREKHNPEKGDDSLSNEDWLYDEYGICTQTITSQFETLWKGSETSLGEVVESINERGYFKVTSTYDFSTEYLCKIIGKKNTPSLYRGKLF